MGERSWQCKLPWRSKQVQEVSLNNIYCSQTVHLLRDFGPGASR
jgi:hypothetical protein